MTRNHWSTRIKKAAYAAAEKAAATRWQLSEREWEIVRSLGAKD